MQFLTAYIPFMFEKNVFNEGVFRIPFAIANVVFLPINEGLRTVFQTWYGMFFLTVLTMVWGGCAALHQNEVADVEGLLTRAGFTKMVADTPEKIAHLKSLPQQRLIHHQRDGKKYVLYAV